MPEVGLEPTLPCGNGILNPARLPIPPLWHGGLAALLYDLLGGIASGPMELGRWDPSRSICRLGVLVTTANTDVAGALVDLTVVEAAGPPANGGARLGEDFAQCHRLVDRDASDPLRGACIDDVGDREPTRGVIAHRVRTNAKK